MSTGQRLSPHRSGWVGYLDRLTGPGATAAELWLQFLPALGALVAAPVYASTLPMQWSGLQLGLMGLLALDLVGGVLTNATVSAKRWYHRPGQGWWQHLGFVALHVVHVFLVAWLFRGGDWLFFGAVAGYLLGAATVIVFSPRRLQIWGSGRVFAGGRDGDCVLAAPVAMAGGPGAVWGCPVGRSLLAYPNPGGRWPWGCLGLSCWAIATGLPQPRDWSGFCPSFSSSFWSVTYCPTLLKTVNRVT
ncbi:hypothetical protein [Sodalinema gerasimenkoae]|uniref:hypothetical protein n=1 Tax=Sodalinema gerasimenkoae TaxID=2862348 RepID=UPI0018657E7D|nr:hypothetical protein [Sodalinema gerasimenkoae]